MSTAHGIIRYRALWAQLGARGRIALTVVLLTTVIVVLSLRGLVVSLLVPAPRGPAQESAGEQQRVEQFAKSFDSHLAQINGRSMFFVPSPPRRTETARTEDPGPRAPTSYGGPALLGFANNTVYFADGRRLVPGEKTEGTLRVKSVSPPWSAVVEWEGVEFTVNLFDHDRVVLSEKKAVAAPLTPQEVAAQSKPPEKPAPAPPSSTAPPSSAPASGSPPPANPAAPPSESGPPGTPESTPPPPAEPR